MLLRVFIGSCCMMLCFLWKRDRLFPPHNGLLRFIYIRLTTNKRDTYLACTNDVRATSPFEVHVYRRAWVWRVWISLDFVFKRRRVTDYDRKEVDCVKFVRASQPRLIGEFWVIYFDLVGIVIATLKENPVRMVWITSRRWWDVVTILVMKWSVEQLKQD